MVPKQLQQAVVAGWVTLQHVQHPDLLLKHSNETLATNIRKQLKHLQHVSKTLTKHLKKLLTL
jgi:hypothetical protein